MKGLSAFPNYDMIGVMSCDRLVFCSSTSLQHYKLFFSEFAFGYINKTMEPTQFKNFLLVCGFLFVQSVYSDAKVWAPLQHNTMTGESSIIKIM